MSEIPEQNRPPESSGQRPEEIPTLRSAMEAFQRLTPAQQQASLARLRENNMRKLTRIVDQLGGRLKDNYAFQPLQQRGLSIAPRGYRRPLQLSLPPNEYFTNMSYNQMNSGQMASLPRFGQKLQQLLQPLLQKYGYEMPVYNLQWGSNMNDYGSIYLPQNPLQFPVISQCNGAGHAGGPAGQPVIHGMYEGPGGQLLPYTQNQQTGQIVSVAKKPVIYLYPTKATDVTVSVDLPGGSMVSEYPASNDGTWSVHAETDGTLTDAEKKSYGYLFWEGLLGQDIVVNQDNATCVKNADYAGFLETSLAQLGLNARERNDFIVYWLPVMQKHPHALVRFCAKDYTAQAPLSVTPKPDSMIRVFMAFEGVQKHVSAKGQTLPHGKRSGFTVVEWGGTEVTSAAKRQAK